MNGTNALLSAIITDRAGVEQDMRVPLVAISAFIDGPLGILPAIIAAERKRRDTTVSKGALANFCEVPNVTQSSLAKATAALSDRGFASTVRQVRVDGVEKGIVLNQSPTGFAEVRSTVALTVSAGPTGGGRDQALAIIENMGEAVLELGQSVDTLQRLATDDPALGGNSPSQSRKSGGGTESADDQSGSTD